MNVHYSQEKNWYKGNLHLHSTRSDGQLTVAALAEKYAAENFDFIALTDHWQVPEPAVQKNDAPLLILDGTELDGCDENGVYHHVVVIGAVTELLVANRDFIQTMDRAVKNGSLLIWAHPHWTGNSFDDGVMHPFHGLEVYNHVSHCENGSGSSLAHWDSMLEHRPDLLGFATDDAHFTQGEPYWNGGWIMVNCESRTERDLLTAIRSGNFYSSQGPDFKTITCNGDMVTVTTSPIMYARLIGPRREGYSINGLDSGPFTEAVFTVPPHWSTARIEIEDEQGKLAWTNPLFGRNSSKENCLELHAGFPHPVISDKKETTRYENNSIQ